MNPNRSTDAIRGRLKTRDKRSKQICEEGRAKVGKANRSGRPVFRHPIDRCHSFRVIESKPA